MRRKKARQQQREHAISRACTQLAVALLLLSALLPASARAQAFCALRDPHTSIAALYPEATSHRSIVRSLGPTERERMQAEFGQELRSTELGRHTVYAVFRETTPLGLVHVRSEKARFGMVEIAWALDLDLRIDGLEIQRGHDAAANALLAGPFAERLDKSSFAEVGAQHRLGADSEWLADLPAEQLWFAVLLLEAAPRTMAATRIGWGTDLAGLRALRAEAR